MTHSFRKPAVWFSFAVLTIAILYCGMWYVTGTILRQQAEAWFQSRQTENLAITYNAPTLSGFPGRIGVDFPGFSIAAPRINNTAGWSWRSDTLRLFLHPFAFQTVHVDLSGAHILAGICDVPLLLTLTRGETSFAFTQERSTAITADISGLSGTWQNETAADFTLSDHFRPISVEHLTARFIHTLISVRTEEITLRL